MGLITTYRGHSRRTLEPQWEGNGWRLLPYIQLLVIYCFQQIRFLFHFVFYYWVNGQGRDQWLERGQNAKSKGDGKRERRKWDSNGPGLTSDWHYHLDKASGQTNFYQLQCARDSCPASNLEFFPCTFQYFLLKIEWNIHCIMKPNLWFPYSICQLTDPTVAQFNPVSLTPRP